MFSNCFHTLKRCKVCKAANGHRFDCTLNKRIPPRSEQKQQPHQNNNNPRGSYTHYNPQQRRVPNNPKPPTAQQQQRPNTANNPNNNNYRNRSKLHKMFNLEHCDEKFSQYADKVLNKLLHQTISNTKENKNNSRPRHHRR